MPIKNQRTSRASSYEVALLAGVSQATVSRVFSPGKSKVSDQTRKRVLEVTRQLNYQPSIIARSLSNNSTKMIAFISGRMEMAYYGKILETTSDTLAERGYTTLFIHHKPVSSIEEKIPLALQYKVDGIVITTSTLSSRLATLCSDMGTPVVLFGRYSVSGNINAVCLDNIQAGRDAAMYLVKKGHRRLAFMGGDINTTSNQGREQGFVEAAKESGVEVSVYQAGEYEYAAGCECARRFLASKSRPDGFFCASDLLAAGLMDVARKECGLDIPRDFSVIGINDDLISRLMTYNLTTIQQPIERMVESAVKLLLGAIEGGTDSAMIKLFPGSIFERGTVTGRKESPTR